MEVSKDFLMRQIEDLGRVLGILLSKIFGLKSTEKTSEILTAVSVTLKNETGIELEIIISLSEAELTEFLKNKFHMQPYLYGLLADILRITADSVLDPVYAVSLYKKALQIMNLQVHYSETFSVEGQIKIKELQTKIDSSKQYK